MHAKLSKRLGARDPRPSADVRFGLEQIIRRTGKGGSEGFVIPVCHDWGKKRGQDKDKRQLPADARFTSSTGRVSLATAPRESIHPPDPYSLRQLVCLLQIRV